MILKMLAIAAVVAGLCYLLYRNGFLVLNTKRALVYIGSPRIGKNRNCLKATFSVCNGSIRQFLRLKKACRYRFVLASDTTKGSVCVRIRGRGEAAELNAGNPSAVIETDAAGKCCVIVQFTRADGNYALCWEEDRSRPSLN